MIRNLFASQVFLGGAVLADIMKDKNNFWALKTDYIQGGGSKGGGYKAAIDKTDSMKGFA